MKNMCGTPTQVFSHEFFELFKNSYFVEDLRKAGSENVGRNMCERVFFVNLSVCVSQLLHR